MYSQSVWAEMGKMPLHLWRVKLGHKIIFKCKHFVANHLINKLIYMEVVNIKALGVVNVLVWIASFSLVY